MNVNEVFTSIAAVMRKLTPSFKFNGALVYVPAETILDVEPDHGLVLVVCQSIIHYQAWQRNFAKKNAEILQIVGQRELHTNHAEYRFVVCDEHMGGLRGTRPRKIILYNILLTREQWAIISGNPGLPVIETIID